MVRESEGFTVYHVRCPWCIDLGIRRKLKGNADENGKVVFICPLHGAHTLEALQEEHAQKNK